MNGLFQGDGRTHDLKLPPAPPWRTFTHAGSTDAKVDPGQNYVARPAEISAVNVAMTLRRPLLITGKPGVGKTTLARAVAWELRLGEVLTWSISSRSTLQQGLYQYDALGRLNASALAEKQGGDAPSMQAFLRLGALGSAFALSQPGRPRVLLIDEIDKSDIDLPNDLLHLFEEGWFEIPELARLPDSAAVPVRCADGATASIVAGRVSCTEFPIVFMTSNGERDFPPAFLRRCIRLDIAQPDDKELRAIARKRLGAALDQLDDAALDAAIQEFLQGRNNGELATDQLLNLLHLLRQGFGTEGDRKLVLRDLGA